MENNEQVQEETQKQNTATDAEQVEGQDGQEETKDWKAEALKNKAILERKDKKLQEILSGNKPEEQVKKPNTEQNVPTMEHVALFGQGATMEEVKMAEKEAKMEGISLTEAYNGEFCQSKFADMRQKAQVKANSLPASSGSPSAPRKKTPGNMTDEEHRAYAEEKLANAING